MRTTLAAILSLALTGLLAPSSPALAQQKTEKACKSEWQANKADNQAKGITEKAYVEQCRSAGAAATPPATPAAAKPAPTVATPAPAPRPATPPPAAKPSPTAATTPAGGSEFSSEAQAKARCPTDTVVWANLKSKIYHFAGHKDYGNTKEGAYMCEKDATAQGIRAAKNEKHPA
jgi:uncharacterized membrane protein